jgi:SWI/SNF-related matrix-associated actin-dependent regulator of chromatin subfamily A3
LVQVNGTSTKAIGMLDLVTTEYLHSLGTFSELSFTAVLASSSLHDILRKPTRKEKVVDTSVNIIGPERIADDVGGTLADASAYLQHPFFLQTGIQYINPQYFYPGDEKTDLRHFVGPPTTDSRSTHVSEGVECILNALDDPSYPTVPAQDQAVSAVAGEGLILTSLKRFGLSAAVQ